MVGLEGDVGDEVADRPATRGVPVGRGQRVADVARQGRRDRRVVARTKVGVADAADVPHAGQVRPAGSAAGRGRAGRLATAVLPSTTPRSRSRWASAQPSEMGPPQSWPTVTTGPVTPSASVSVPRSATRCASGAGPAGAFGEPHAEVVGGDDAPPRRAPRR